MKHVNLLIKPASSLCNLRCRYCFYADVAENRTVPNMGIMSLETAEKLIAGAFNAVDARGSINFAFQGGEPTVAGLSFFKDFVQLVDKRGKPDIHVSYSMQTNGTHIDSDWADFFYKNNVLVGLSIDGTKDLHDLNRIDSHQSGTYNKVSKALRLLQKSNVSVNLLCVVTGSTARHPLKVYASLKKLGVTHLQFIPCLDPLEQKRAAMPFSLTPQGYGDFLCGLFDAWYHDWESGQYTSIRLFDDYVHLAMGFPSGTCSTTGRCGGYVVAEGDGSLYPCDFYVLDQWKLGSISDASLTDIAGCALATQFIDESLVKPNKCSACQWYGLCNGGCKRDWVNLEGNLENYYCSAFKQFFFHAAQRIEYIAQVERRHRLIPS